MSANPAQAAAASPPSGLWLTFSAPRCGSESPDSVAAALPTLGIGLPLTLPCSCASSRLEDVYLVYTSEKNRGLTLRLHFMLITAWAVGAAKTVTQAVHALQQ